MVWLGSIAWDGYPDEIPETIRFAHDDKHFRAEVAQFLASRDDGTKPEDGWPWPWDDSRTTDYSYVFHEGKCDVYCFGHPEVIGGVQIEEAEPKASIFPNMKVAWGRRSGLIVIGG